jgi:chemotaxis protein MotB
MSGQGGTKVIIIKKKAKHAGHHGGAWKVAYADFVTAMMALFIVLWLLTQTDQSSKAAISQYFRTGTLPGGTLMLGTPAGSNPPVPINIFESGSAGGASPDASLSTLTKNIKKLIGDPAASDPETAGMGQHLAIRETPEGTLIELIDGSDNFLFPVGSPELKPGAVKFLSKLAPLLAKLKNKIEIHGHTDARPFEKGAKKGNWELSFDRANEARRVLEEHGVQLGRISSVQAHADSQLFNKEDPYSPENRRLAILIVRRPPKTKPLPATDPAAQPPTSEPAPPPAAAEAQTAEPGH